MKYRLFLVILSLTGASLILLAANQYGAGISQDSVGYIATARHIAAGKGIVTYSGDPAVMQPPLYPAVLALSTVAFGVDPLKSAHVVNAILFGLSIYLAGLLLLKHFTSAAILALMGTASLLVLPPLSRVFLMAWSEPLFICLVVAYLICMQTYIEKKNLLSLLPLSVAVALSCLTRYIGALFILTGAIGILLYQQGSLRVKLKYVSLFIFISGLPISIWLARNFLLTGTLFGHRATPIFTLSDNLSLAINTIWLWYIPGWLPPVSAIVLLFCVVTGLAVGVSFILTKSSDLPGQIHPTLFNILLVIILYMGFLVISSTTTAYDQIGDRLLSPIAVPFTFLLLSLIKFLSTPLKAHYPEKLINLFLAAGMLVWSTYPAGVTSASLLNHFNEGFGYSGRLWRNSPTIHYLNQHRTLETECVIYSNAPDAVYILAELTARRTPRKTMYNSAEVVEDTSKLKGTWPEADKACLVWFNNVERGSLFTLAELRTIVDAEKIAHFEDGAIYTIKRK